MDLELLEPRRFLSLTPIGGATIVSQSQDARAFDVAAADNGLYLVATETIHHAPTADQPTTGEIEIVRYSTSGEQLGDVFTINLVFPNNSAPFPRVRASMDADGDAIVVYPATASSNEFGAVRAVRISKAGVMGTPFDVLPPIADEGGYSLPAISLDDNGGFFLAYLGASDNVVDDGAIRVQAFDGNNAPLDDSFQFRAFGISESFDNVEIEAYADGSGAIVATGTLGGEGPTAVEFARVSASAIVGERTSLGGGSTSFPSIAIHADKSFVLGYERQSGPLGEPPAIYQIFAQRYNASAVAQGSPIEIGSTLPGTGLDKHTYGLDVAPLSDGGFVASFAQLIGNTDTFYAERYDASGVRDGAPVTLDASVRTFTSFPATEQGGQTFVAATGEDIAIAAWINPAQSVVKTERLASALGILLDRGSLTAFGTANDDTITVEIDNGQVTVRHNNTTKNFAASDVQFISINGFAGNDTIDNITAIPSTLSGGEGDDTVFGGDSADRIRGEVGRDSLWGRDGNDTIFGDDGPDSLYGNGGRDRIDGGANSDFIRGNAARDKLFGGHGNDRIYGSESADWLYGGIGNDQLFGEGGNDLLYGDNDADTLSGSAGDDFLHTVGDGDIDFLFGDRGHDSAYFDIERDVPTGIEFSW
jgi:Ca2+-binding RTX toxin-like protein